jgi:hypothetical protein
MRLQIIQLEPYDDVISTRDRLAFVKAERVLLILPKQGGILRRKLDLVLLQREAARRGARLALISDDLAVIENARELNISVFRNLRESQRKKWRKPRQQVFWDRQSRPEQPDALDLHELRLRASRLRPLTARQRRRQRLIRDVAALVLIAVVLIAAYLLLPAAEVIITPSQAQISASLPIIADPNATQIDVEHGRVPAIAEILEVEATVSIPPSGLVDVPSGRATGEVVFYNLIESAVEVPANTILSTVGARARFRTLADATLPAGVGKTAKVPIEALDESLGVAGNVQAGAIINIEGNLNRLLSVRNLEPTRGGTVREQRVVTRADYDRLLVIGRAQLLQNALAEVSARLGGTQIVVPNGIRILNEGAEEATYSAFIGDQADSLSLTLRARIQALVIDEQMARQAVLARLSREIPSGQRLLLDTITYNRSPLQAADAQGRVTFLMYATASVMANVDSALVRQRLAGLSVEAALARLNRELLLDPLRPPQIALYPDLFGRLPALPARITVTIRAPQSAGLP